MYTRESDTCAIDSISCVEVNSKQPPGEDGMPVLELKMVYFNTKNGISFGSCTVEHNGSRGKAGILSPVTLEKLRAFLNSAEEDYGRLVFGAGRIIEGSAEAVEDEDPAETNRPPRIGLGGGRL